MEKLTDEQIKSLQTELQETKARLITVETNLLAKTDELKVAGDLLAAKAHALLAADERIGALNTELSATVEINTKLSATIQKMEFDNQASPSVKVEKTGTVTVSEETFSIDGEEYEFVFAKMNSRDGVITANEVLASEDLQRKLKASGSGMIRPKKK